MYNIWPGPSRATAGPGKTLRGALSPPPYSVCLEIENRDAANASRGRKRGERCPLTIRLGVRWDHRKLTQHGCRGGAQAKNGFYAYFRSEKSHLEHNFQYFWPTAGAPKRCGARENFLPFPPLDGPVSGVDTQDSPLYLTNTTKWQ